LAHRPWDRPFRPRHRLALYACAELQRRIERLPGAAVRGELDRLEQAVSACVTDEGMIAEPFVLAAR
jgi:hypothetical protein